MNTARPEHSPEPTQDTILNSADTQNSPYERHPRVKEKYWGEGYLDKFDATTLWYDAIWSPGLVRVIAPSPLNLRNLYKSARFLLDDTAVAPKRIRRFYRHMVIELPAPDTAPARLTMQAQDARFTSGISICQWELFRGKNVQLNVICNDDLDWITDNIRYHMQEHGMDGLLLFNNKSALYSTTELRQVIKQTGLPAALVLDADFRYGPRGIAPFANTELFLQTALYNIAKHRWLAQARAVLCSDTDELVVSDDGISIFDATYESRLGYVLIPEKAVHLPPGFTGKPTHAAHTHFKEKKNATTKWCLRPDSKASAAEWRVHKLENSFYNHFARTKRFALYHYQGLHTGWKSQERLRPYSGTTFFEGAQRVSQILSKMPPLSDKD